MSSEPSCRVHKWVSFQRQTVFWKFGKIFGIPKQICGIISEVK